MDISKSNKNWKCKVCVFSGRPDPVWKPSEKVVLNLLDIIEKAHPVSIPYKLPEGLGYRGLCLFSNETLITAYHGLIYISDGDLKDVRKDENLRFYGYFINHLPKKFDFLKVTIMD
ncbi:MAG: hypothetical protein IPN73_07570 [Saprospiraceae bacterium]|nr:hypothetical protein [Saprospiraceae bacterium]